MTSLSHRGGDVSLGAIYSGADLQSYITNLVARGFGGIVQLPPGTFILTSEIVVQQAIGLTLRGSTMQGGTKIQWSGASGNIFRFLGTQNCGLQDLWIEVAGTASSGVVITDEGAGLVRSSGFTADNVFFNCGEGKCAQPFYVQRTPDGAKNDHHTFRKVQAQGYSFAFARLEGQASVNNMFIGCRAQSRDYGSYGIYAKDDVNINEGGQFQVEGGIWMEHDIADFYTNTRLGTNLIHKAFGEQSARHLIVEDAGSAYAGVLHIIRDCRFTVPNSLLPADGEIVQVYAGGLVIDSNTFGVVAANQDFRFRYDVPAAKRLGFMFTGNVVNTSLAAGHFPALAPDSVAGSYRRTGSATVAF